MKRRRWLYPLIALVLGAAALVYDRWNAKPADIPPALPPDQRAPLRFDVPASMAPPGPVPPAPIPQDPGRGGAIPPPGGPKPPAPPPLPGPR